jgi:hypothetical protein
MRNVSPEVALTEALDAIAADLRQTLAGLLRPPGLIEAETRVIQTREARAAAWDAYRAAIGELGRSLSRDPATEAEIHRKKAALDAAEGEVVREQRALARDREAHGRTINTAIERHRLAAAAALAGGASILAEAAAAAAREFVILPDLVEHTPAMQGMIEAAGRSRMAQQNRAERQFSRSAASMAARAAPPQPAASTKWTGKLSDMIGGEVVDGPIPISPGSSTTVQRIPPSAMANGAAAAPVGPLRLSAATVGAAARLVLRKR